MKVLKLGAKYKSAVCDAQIMVIRTIAEPVDLRCGGVAMLDAGDRIELLCTKGGKGSISLGGDKLPVKQAKALPSSD